MTSPSSPPDEIPETADDDDPLRLLVRDATHTSERAEHNEANTPRPERDPVRAVQKKIHERSGGRFFYDGWSRSTLNSSRLLALLMLGFAIAVYVILRSVTIP